MDGFIVAIAHFDQVPGQFVGGGMAVLDVVAKITAMTAEGLDVFVEGLEQFEDFAQLLFGHFLVGRQIAQADVFRAKLDEDFVHLDVVIHVFHAFFAGDLVERRLGDIDKPLPDQLRHLPVKKRQQ